MERLVDDRRRRDGHRPRRIAPPQPHPAEAMPYKAPNGTTYDSGDFTNLLNEALQLADWDGFAARKEESRERGAGCAAAASAIISN